MIKHHVRIEKVLLADDDAGIRRVAEISLSRVGKWKVLLVDSGAKALECVGDFKPDLILLDVMMPGMDGPTTFTHLQEDERSAGIPVIFLTAKVQKQEMQVYRELGAAGIISKPFDPITLPAEIMRVLSDRLEPVLVA
jgi:two-component system, OmpR family, response regulator